MLSEAAEVKARSAIGLLVLKILIASRLVRESIDGRRLNGAGYLIEVARLCGRHKILRKPCAKSLQVVQL